MRAAWTRCGWARSRLAAEPGTRVHGRVCANKQRVRTGRHSDSVEQPQAVVACSRGAEPLLLSGTSDQQQACALLRPGRMKQQVLTICRDGQLAHSRPHLEQTVDTAHGELQAGPAGARCGLLLQVAAPALASHHGPACARVVCFCATQPIVLWLQVWEKGEGGSTHTKHALTPWLPFQR